MAHNAGVFSSAAKRVTLGAVSLGPFEAHARDLAPGDRAVLDASWASFSIRRVRAVDDPLFDEAYRRLWNEFGARGEMERREVLADRLAWDPRRPLDGHAFLYELVVVQRDGEIVAVRDHTAIVPPGVAAGDGQAAVVVHLSHVLIEPALRGIGLASWLRALPVDTARRCIAAAMPSRPASAAPPITLVAEMEHDDGVTPAMTARLRSYARAGFRVVDPARLAYHQPDFRSALEIERGAVESIPLALVIRRVGHEHDTTIGAAELTALVDALLAMFAVHVRADHMRDARRHIEDAPSSALALLVPGAASQGSR